MTARLATWPFLFVFPAMLFVFAPAMASSPTPQPWIPGPGEYYSEFRGGSFSTHSYHDDLGNRQDLGIVVQQRSLISYNEIGWKKSLSMILGVPALSVTSRSESGPLVSNDTGLSDLLLGLRYKILGGSLGLTLEADWIPPLGYNRNLSPGLGDGYQEVDGALAAGGGIGRRVYLQGSGGYRYRFFDTPFKSEKPAVLDDSGKVVTPATLLEWQQQVTGGADVGVWLGPSLLVVGRYAGFVTVAHGSLSSKVELHRVGPEVLYRVDDHIDVFAGSMHTASAKNALHTDEYYVGVAYKQTRLNRLQGILGGKREP